MSTQEKEKVLIHSHPAQTADYQVTRYGLDNTRIMKTKTINRTLIQTLSEAGLADYEIREETINHIDYLIVPVVMMVEGVHNGSKGPMLHKSSELAKSATAWNGMPVVIHHPQDGEGNYISANSPDVINYAVGKVFNARMDGDKLRADVYLEEQKLLAMSPEAHQSIKEKKPLDVSVGVFSSEVIQEGEWNGETYKAIATNHRPDHLALLPGDVGACSWSDGCGIRVNQQNKPLMEKEEITVFKKLALEFVTYATGFQEIMSKIAGKLDSMDDKERYYMLEEVFDGSFIYKVREPQTNELKMYRQNYSILDNQQIEFTGNPVEVQRRVEYITLQRNKGNEDADNIINNQNEGGSKMSDQKSPCLKAKVDALINNKLTHFAEADREWLLTQSEDLLNKLEPIEPPKPEKQESAPPTVNREKALEVLNLKELKDFTQIMPEALRAQVESGLQLREQRRTKLIELIQTNSEKDTWTDDELKEMSCNMLEKLAKTTGQELVDYSGAGAGNDDGKDINNNNDHVEEPLLPPGVE